jgi:hypothetical protein
VWQWLRNSPRGWGATTRRRDQCDLESQERAKVIIAGTNDAKEDVTDGGIVGEGTFRAGGAITDKGTARA